MVPLDPHESGPNSNLDQFGCSCIVHPCAQHTDHTTSVAMGRIDALLAGDVV